MLLTIKHRTSLKYSETTQESVMEMRMHPRVDDRQVVRQFDVTVNPESRIACHVDWLGNSVHQFSLLKSHDEVTVVSRSLVETRPSQLDVSSMVAPLHGLINDHRWRDFLGFDGPVKRDERLSNFSQKIGLDAASKVGEAIRLVMSETRELLEYKRGVTTTSSNVCDVLDAKVGVCQDFAHIGLSLLRQRGVPCRYVSGHLYQESETQMESHAWCEAYVPGIGWVGFDPTHATMIDEGYVSVAAGRNYSDVPPHRGVFRGTAHQTLAASVTIERANNTLRPLPFATQEAPNTAARPVRSVRAHSLSQRQEFQPVDPAAFASRLTQQRQQQQ